jgi:signal transduction histidine kinase
MDLTNLTHELRTPLNAALGQMQLLLTEDLTDAVRRRLAIIESQILRMTRLVENCVTDLAMRAEPVDLNATLSTVIAELEVLLRRHEVRVVFNRGDAPQVAGDADGLHRVFMNILTNALESMPEGGLIAVGVRTHGIRNTVATFAEIEIADTGIGIAPDLIPRVFDHGFSTKNSSRLRGHGLAICRQIVQAHGGRLELFSEQHIGTSVRILLPVAAETPVA